MKLDKNVDGRSVWIVILRLCFSFTVSYCLISVQLNKEEIAERYGTRRIGRDQAHGLVGLMDFFCFSEVSATVMLYSTVMQWKSCITLGGVVSAWGLGMAVLSG